LSWEISVTMPGAGRVERLWRTVKYEDIYIKDYETKAAWR